MSLKEKKKHKNGSNRLQYTFDLNVKMSGNEM